MKNLFYLFILTVGLLSCKKSNNEPTPQQAITTPPPNPNDTTGNNTNDTVGKVKIYCQLQLTPLTIGYGAGMSGRDYVHDTTNVRILRNGVKIPNTVSVSSTLAGSLGLNSIDNLANPVWCSIGDTITFELDSNEVNFTSGALSDRLLGTSFKVWKNAPYFTSNLKYNFDSHNYSAYPECEAIYQGIIIAGNAGYNNYLGTVNNTMSGLPQSFYIGGKLRMNYIVQ